MNDDEKLNQANEQAQIKVATRITMKRKAQFVEGEKSFQLRAMQKMLSGIFIEVVTSADLGR